MSEFYDNILPLLDQRLGRNEFLCGEYADVTIADIQIYNEIVTILTLQKRELDELKLPNLAKWYKKLAAMPEIVEADKKLKEILTKYNFI